MAPSRIEMLQRMPIFGAIGDAALAFLLGRAGQLTVEPGRRFFAEGEVAQSMFVLEAGRAEAHKRRGEHWCIVSRFGPGDCFGEMALLDLHPRSATVIATERCRAIEIAAGDLLALYEHDLESFALIQMNLAREMSRRLRATDERLFELDGEGR